VPKIKQGQTVYLIGIDDDNLAKPMRVFIQNNNTRNWVREHANKTMRVHNSKRKAQTETRLYNAIVTRAR
jgi:uncharacterized protein YaaQ